MSLRQGKMKKITNAIEDSKEQANDIFGDDDTNRKKYSSKMN